jgi:hypothetical protein
VKSSRGLGDRSIIPDRGKGGIIFLFTTASRPGLGPAQPLIQWVSRPLTPGVKGLMRESDHSSPSTAEVKYAWNSTCNTPSRGVACFSKRHVFMVWFLVKHSDNFTFTFTFILSKYYYGFPVW